MVNQNRIVRKRRNLVYKRGINMIRKPIWFIGKYNNLKMFYVSDYDDNDNTILWSNARKNAIKFKTERSVNRFIQKHLRDRSDVILVYSEIN